MENNQPSFLTRNKRSFIIAGLGLIILGLSLFIIFNQERPHHYASQFSKYIESYTSGTISKKNFIRIKLSGDVQQMQDIGAEVRKELFDFSPSIKGKTYWIDAQTIEFRPSEAMKPGQTYEGVFHLSKVMSTEKALQDFEFDFRVINAGMSVSQDGLIAQNNTSMDYLKLSGSVMTADEESSKAIEKAIKLNFEQNLGIKWQHNPNKHISIFIIDSIRKTDAPRNMELRWTGEPIGAPDRGNIQIKIPALGDFDILDIRAVQDQEDYILVQFSEPVDVTQDLTGLFTLNGSSDLRFTIDGSEVRVYAAVPMEGKYEFVTHKGIQNIQGKALSRAKSVLLSFENKLPSVAISGTGTILPNSGKLLLPFEAINLRAVDVTVIKIYENNIPQFFQNNNYNDDYELRRVGRPVVQKVVRLDEDKALNLHKRHLFTLDLDRMIKTEPGAMYRITLGFRSSYNVYQCGNDKEIQTESGTEEFQGYGEKIDEDDQFWQRYYDYYPADYTWQDRDNPCTPSYYTREKWSARNVIASNIGLIAKRGNDQSMTVIATNLLDAKPLSGATIELLDYQRQIIYTAQTDGGGIARFTLKRKPFLLMAKNGAERAYLKLDDGNALPLSRFDVGGDVVQNGLKGMIYGERGVWRPGDSLYVSFILNDDLNRLPKDYPVTFELYNPRGQLSLRKINGKPLNGFYSFKIGTDKSSPTGNWMAKVKAGGAVFTKTLKIETVAPNRLKIKFDINNADHLGSGGPSYATLSANWLFGAPGKNLKAKVDVNLNTMTTSFKGYEGFTFDNPTVTFDTQLKTIFNGTLDGNGEAKVNTNLNVNKAAPGMLRANFTTKVFEAGGGFSIDNFSIPYHLYSDYYGIKAPEGDRLTGMLVTGKDHPIRIVNVDDSGQLIKDSKSVQVELYKIQWRWWWEKDDQNTLANFAQNAYNKLIQKEQVALTGGKATWNLRVNEPEWGRYLIMVRDLSGGHVTGKTVYVDWPGWAKRERNSNPAEAAMLSFTADKTQYKIGEEVTLTFPSGADGRALISIENGTRVIKTFWTDTRAGQTQFKFKAGKEMTPNIFVNVTLLQPHDQTLNDLPIRMYGAIPLYIEDPKTVLKPVIQMADKIRPETINTLKIQERNGRAMTYTIAIVDEGLLDLTRFKTPDPHAVFYAREALGVKTWDLFDYVLGAWGGNLERILSIGGDGSINRNLNPAKANRFQPVVQYLGPFELTKGAVRTHQFKLPQYIGAVRVMVVAGQNGAYGSADKSVQVKKPLMLLASLPRMIGPGEQFTLPATVFAGEPNIKSVNLKLQSKELVLDGSASRHLSFNKPGEQVVYYQVKAPQSTGIAKIKLSAESGSEKAIYEVELDVRNPNPFVTNVQSKVLQPGDTWNPVYKAIGIQGTNSASLELSSIPPIDLKKRLGYLIQYPHGCLEQTVSAVFPQLFLANLTALSPGEKRNSESNVKKGIQRLRGFQTPDGGFSYWPGNAEADEWGSTYAGHFMMEAQQAGYALPAGLAEGLIHFLQIKASNWAPSTSNFYGADISQAYRLYVLALAKKPDMAAMNRLRSFEYLSTAAKWRLAAAYMLAGQSEAASRLIKGLDTDVKPYQQLGGTYGSELRDQAMILESLTLMKFQSRATQVMRSLARRLGQDKWYSTQTTAYSLLAIAKYCGRNNSDTKLNYDYQIDGKKGNTKSSNYLTTIPLTFRGKIGITNRSKAVLFTNLTISGQPEIGQDPSLPNNPEALRMDLHYKLLNGKTIDPQAIRQGTDFYAEVTIKNPGKLGSYEQMALTQIFPSGWQVVNTRINDNESILASSPYVYQDIRDDRVLTYFNLRENQTVTFKVLLNASYIGRYYLPAVVCEAMYNQEISTFTSGKWVVVMK